MYECCIWQVDCHCCQLLIVGRSKTNLNVNVWLLTNWCLPYHSTSDISTGLLKKLERKLACLVQNIEMAAEAGGDPIEETGIKKRTGLGVFASCCCCDDDSKSEDGGKEHEVVIPKPRGCTDCAFLIIYITFCCILVRKLLLILNVCLFY